jgi:drug/metabolite transporter (DMT)-like permease
MPRRNLPAFEAPALIAALALVWGLTYVLLSVALRGMAASTLSFIRALGGSVIVVLVRPAAFRRALAYASSDLLGSCAMGSLNVAIPFWLIAVGERTVSPGVTAVLLATSPAMVGVVAGWRIPTERLGVVPWLGVTIGTVGVAVVVGATPSQIKSLTGALAILGAAVSYALGSLLAKCHAARQDEWEQTVTTLFTGALLLAIPGVLLAPSHIPALEPSLATAALVAGTATSFVLLFRAVAVGGAGFSLRPIYLSPAVSIVGGAIILGEAVTPGLAVGSAIAISGVVMATIAAPRHRASRVGSTTSEQRA